MRSAIYCDPCRGKCKDRSHRAKPRRSWVQRSEPGEQMTGRVYFRLRTAGGTTVDLSLRGAECRGCGMTSPRGRGAEIATREWMAAHAVECEKAGVR